MQPSLMLKNFRFNFPALTSQNVCREKGLLCIVAHLLGPLNGVIYVISNTCSSPAGSNILWSQTDNDITPPEGQIQIHIRSHKAVLHFFYFEADGASFQFSIMKDLAIFIFIS